MSKHPKHAFGLSEDARVLRLVHLSRDNDQLYLHGAERVDMDSSLYHPLQAAFMDQDGPGWQDESTEDQELVLDEYDSSFGSHAVKTQPWEILFNSQQLSKGVIALNVNDENLVWHPHSAGDKLTAYQFAKANLGSDQYKAKEWRVCKVKRHRVPHMLLHKGGNQLLNLIANYGKQYRHPLFFQLADANEIALTDYFAIYGADEQKRDLLVYLGNDYRCAFMFEQGKWSHTLPLQITQSDPQPSIVYSKLGLALDSEQLGDPDRLVFCGDLVNQELLEYMKKQYGEDAVQLLTYPHLITVQDSLEIQSPLYLSHFALSIALAHKALHPEDTRFTPSNFLPSRVVESQKTFKVAWHGFMILSLIFLLSMYATISLLTASSNLSQAKREQRRLALLLVQRRQEAAEIQEIRKKLEAHQKSLEEMRNILKDKNPWTQVLETLNRRVGGLPVTWLTNLKLNNGLLNITGITTNRNHILSLADVLPNSQILKVSESKIKDVRVWDFEINSELPAKDWVGEIEEDLKNLMELKQQYGEDRATNGQNNASPPVNVPGGVLSLRVPAINDLRPYRGLSPIINKCMPVIPEKVIKNSSAELEEYNTLIQAINQGNKWVYRDLGVKFINKHTSSSLSPYAKWLMAYRLFIDREFELIHYYNEPLLSSSGDLAPYALLLSARADYVQGNSGYKDKYARLKNDYARHAIKDQVLIDLKVTERGDK